MNKGFWVKVSNDDDDNDDDDDDNDDDDNDDEGINERRGDCQAKLQRVWITWTVTTTDSKIEGREG